MPVNLQDFEGLSPEEIRQRFTQPEIQEAVAMTENQPATNLFSKVAGNIPQAGPAIQEAPAPSAPPLPSSGSRPGSDFDLIFQGTYANARADRDKVTAEQARLERETDISQQNADTQAGKVTQTAQTAQEKAAAELAADNLKNTRLQRERVTELLQTAIDNIAGGSSPSANMTAFLSAVQREELELSPRQIDQHVTALQEATPGLDLSPEQETRLSKLASLEDGIQRIRKAVIQGGPGLSKSFGIIGNGWQRMIQAISKGDKVDADIRQAWSQIGLTAEMGVRLFSGAAVTEDEFNRWSNVFLGELAGGPNVLLQNLNNLETEFRTQRTNLIDFALKPEAVNPGIGRLSDDAFLNMTKQALNNPDLDEGSRQFFLDEINQNRPNLKGELHQMLERRKFGTGQGTAPFAIPLTKKTLVSPTEE